jgi:hypothetical protein
MRVTRVIFIAACALSARLAYAEVQITAAGATFPYPIYSK